MAGPVRCSSTHPSLPSSSFVVPHRFEGIFVANGKTLYTKNLVPGEAFYDEILIPVQNDDGSEVEYREWNPSSSKLAAAILCGASNIWIRPGSRVLYLGASCGTTISYISDLVGPEGVVYAVEKECSYWSTLVNMAEKRLNVVPILEDALHALKYRMLVPMVDVMFATVTDPKEARIVSLNAAHFLKAGGHYVIYVKTSRGEDVFACLSRKKQKEFKPMEKVTLESFDRDHAFIIGGFRILEA